MSRLRLLPGTLCQSVADTAAASEHNCLELPTGRSLWGASLSGEISNGRAILCRERDHSDLLKYHTGALWGALGAIPRKLLAGLRAVSILHLAQGPLALRGTLGH